MRRSKLEGALRGLNEQIRQLDKNDEIDSTDLLEAISEICRVLEMTVNAIPQKRPRRDRGDAYRDKAVEESFIAGLWEGARKGGGSKKEFARDREMSLKDLQKLLNRVRARRLRAR
ncbi:hypothetical protein SH661x_000662 [Planctomicrobium sp. SH661]|uniref:hypothetical protein n=1 Tax=Planctomicrobium sp. SH661 TaxID=3448124 RepID=UPI003F5C0956